jgi:integrase
VGDLIREVSINAHYRVTTFAVYCGALRSIVAGIAKIPVDKSCFAPHSDGNKKWRDRVDATPLSALTAEAIQQWRLDYINSHKGASEAHNRAINTVNAQIRNARSLFPPKALEFARNRLALPDPFASVKLEKKRATTRYSSRIDPAALFRAAKSELAEVPSWHEQFKIFCLALLCGLRKREIDTLLWRSVDFKKAVIRIERTEYFQPKSEESRGEVDLVPELVEILRAFKAKARGDFFIESDDLPRYESNRANYRDEAEFRHSTSGLRARASALAKTP